MAGVSWSLTLRTSGLPSSYVVKACFSVKPLPIQTWVSTLSPSATASPSPSVITSVSSLDGSIFPSNSTLGALPASPEIFTLERPAPEPDPEPESSPESLPHAVRVRAARRRAAGTARRRRDTELHL